MWICLPAVLFFPSQGELWEQLHVGDGGASGAERRVRPKLHRRNDGERHFIRPGLGEALRRAAAVQRTGTLLSRLAVQPVAY